MTLPSSPPASTEPSAFKTWAINVATTAADHETRIDDLEAAPGGGAVDSVNGQTGVVVLDAGDVGAQPADADLTALASAGNSTVLANTTASFLTADETKLDGIEALADVTDTTNVAAAGAVMASTVNAKGDLFAATADDTVTRLAVGSNGQVLQADSAESTGMKWATPSSGGSVATDTIWDAAGDLVVGTGSDTAARLAKGTALQVLRVNAGATALEWATPASGGTAAGTSFTPTAEILSTDVQAAIPEVLSFGATELAAHAIEEETHNIPGQIADAVAAIADGFTFTGDIIVPAEVYGSGWNGSNEAPTKNDLYDKIETLAASDYVRTTSDQSVTSSVTVTAVSALTKAILANEVWEVKFVLLTDGAQAGDIRVAVTVPSGAVLHADFVGTLQSATGTTTPNNGARLSTVASGVEVAGFGTLGAGVPNHVVVTAFVRNGATPGDVEIKFAQRVSDGTATKVLTDSYRIARRLA